MVIAKQALFILWMLGAFFVLFVPYVLKLKWDNRTAPLHHCMGFVVHDWWTFLKRVREIS